MALAFWIMGDASAGEDPDLVRRFVHELKPRGLEQQLQDAQDEAVRALARSLMHTEIYGIRSGKNLRHIQQSGAIRKEEKVEEEGNGDGNHADGDSSMATEASGILGAVPIPPPTNRDPPGHRDETLVGTSDERDREAASRARSAGVYVTDYMKQRLNRQFK